MVTSIGTYPARAQDGNAQFDSPFDALVHANEAALPWWWAFSPIVTHAGWGNAVYHIGNMALYRALWDAGYGEKATEYRDQRSKKWAVTNEWDIDQRDKDYLEHRYADRLPAGQVYEELDDANVVGYNPVKMINAVNDPVLDQQGLWWLDAIFMGGPLLSKLCASEGEQYCDDLDHFYGDTKNTLYTTTGLWKAAPSKPANEYWLRGNGWLIAAMARIVQDIPSHRSAQYKDMLQAMAATLKPLQREDGFWNIDLANNASTGIKETSGTALIAYAMAWGINHNILSANAYKSVVSKAWQAIVCTALNPQDGVVGYVQGSASGPFEHLPTPSSTYSYGVGSFLLAGSEVYFLDKREGLLFLPCTSVLEAENATITNGRVENEHPGFSGTGYVNYDNNTTSDVEWEDLGTINHQAYALALRYANGTSQNRRMDILVNNGVVHQGLSFEGTGSWTSWAIQTTTAVLHSGNAIKAKAITSNGGPNVDYLDLSPVIEAEAYDMCDCTVDNEHAGYTDTGYVNFTNREGSDAEWNVNVSQSGFYVLTFRYANGTNQDRNMSLRVNGQDTGSSVSFLGTGAWNKWALATAMVSLNSGANTLRTIATASQGGPNIDHIGVSFERP